SQSDAKMVKQKNHTARNNTVKAHRNGIKKPKNHRFHSTRGLDPKFLRNQHWAKKFDKKHRNRKNKDKEE
ncbi:60S ribosomal protein L29, partial [Clostridioides difficile]|nr:60S ribosomal protein L29 [Clostridioides difficile]